MEIKFRNFDNTPVKVIKEAFNSKLNPLIVIEEKWISTYHNKLEDKIEVISNYYEWQVLLFAWGWKYRTDVFEVTYEDIQKILSE